MNRKASCLALSGAPPSYREEEERWVREHPFGKIKLMEPREQRGTVRECEICGDTQPKGGLKGARDEEGRKLNLYVCNNVYQCKEIK